MNMAMQYSMLDAPARAFGQLLPFIRSVILHAFYPLSPRRTCGFVPPLSPARVPAHFRRCSCVLLCKLQIRSLSTSILLLTPARRGQERRRASLSHRHVA